MIRNLFQSRLLITLVFAVPVIETPAIAASPPDDYYKAYYLEHEQGDFAAATKLYKQVAGARGVDNKLKSLARSGLSSCQEELAAADLVSLMPPETLVYAELTRPGEQFTQLLDALGLLAMVGEEQPGNQAGGRKIAISPVLVKEMLGLRGAAVAITGFNPQTEMPTGVVVLNPGNLEIIRGVIESILPAAAETVEPTQGHPTYFVAEAKLYVCLASRLVIASPDRTLIEGVLSRVNGTEKNSLANRGGIDELLANRDRSLFFFCANAKKIVPMVAAMAGGGAEFAQAQAILDLDSLQWIAGRGGVSDKRVYFELGVRMDKGHHNLAYNFVRTPPISPETFKSIPKGVAGFLAGSLSEPGTRYSRPEPSDKSVAPAVTGLDIGREIFANVRDFAVYALPPATDGRSEGWSVPDVAAVIRVHEPTRSEALWTQLLGIASLAAGGATADADTERIGGVEARVYQFPQGVKVLVATTKDRLVIATTPYAMRLAVASADGRNSVLNDPTFASSLKNLGPATSKAVFVNPGRCLRIARQFMSKDEQRETAPFVDLLSETVVSVQTQESDEQFKVSATITGLPKVGPLLAQLIEREQRGDQARHALSSARRSGDTDKALQIVNASIEEDGGPDEYRAKFEILALESKDRSGAKACAEKFSKKFADNAQALNNFAWYLLTNKAYERGYDGLALRIAEQACELSEYKSWALLDTLALAKFRAGDVDTAIKLQEKAIKTHGGDHDELNKSLALYAAAKSEL